MTPTNNLHQTISTQKQALKNFQPEIFEIPKYITDNLKHSFFDWQREAFENLLFYEHPNSKLKKSPTHLMFNMATGTGKTLLMAASILYYYKQGYRHFIFFVNQNNIIDKTENNFIENTHNKYLFTEKVIIEDKIIPIEKVNVFSDEPQGIEIKFTSIQKLYNDIHLQRENQTTLDDLQSRNIVMLADEAHHLNANTKKNEQESLIHTELKGNTGKEIVERKGWEHTVIELILNKQGYQGQEQNKNVLLEFTATIPDNKQVANKYQDKIIYQFTLKEFLQAGYTKEINLISSTLDKKERVLQALLFQWYRHQIALKNKIANFKPVILFRSKTIEESKQDYEEFLTCIEDLESKDFDFCQTIASKIHQAHKTNPNEIGKSRTEQVLNYIQKNNIQFVEISDWIKQNFKEQNTIITNSKTNTTKKEKTEEETEKLLNSLEDKNNHIRAIFTVDRLTEGWDVLNLFDIVRLYQGQNTGGSTKKTPEATTKEKQLIGRGVRYFPFQFQDQQVNKRKFDNDLNDELRILEELFYYTYDEDSKYISHLKAELKKDGYIKDDRTIKTFDLKSDFKQSCFYKETIIWYNEQRDNPERKKKDLQNIKQDFSFEYKIQDLELTEQKGILDKTESQESLQIAEQRNKRISKKFSEIEKHIFYKAINIKAKAEGSLFQFENLRKELAITSIDDLRKDEFLGNLELKIITNTNYEEISNKDKLDLTLKFLDKAINQLKEHIHPKIGSEFKAGNFDTFFKHPKRKSIEQNNLDLTIPKDNQWYVLDTFVGTNEEKELVQFIKNSISNLEETYQEIYLLKNEEVYKIYNFKDGKGFAPDFLLFLKTKDKQNTGVASTEIYYQIFIEPKGDQFKDLEGGFRNSKESWKEEFLEQITKKYGFGKVIKAENPNYRLIGLPFYNKASQQIFEEEYNKLLKSDEF